MLHNICRTKNRKEKKKNKELPQAPLSHQICQGAKMYKQSSGAWKAAHLGPPTSRKKFLLRGSWRHGREIEGVELGQPSSLLQPPPSIHPFLLLFIHPSVRSFLRQASRQQLAVISARSCGDLTCRQPRTFKVPERTNAQPVTHISLILKSPAKDGGKGRGWRSVPEKDKEGKQTCRQREVLFLPSLWGYRTRRERSRKGVRPAEEGERALRFYRTGCWQNSFFSYAVSQTLGIGWAQLSHSEHTTRLWKWMFVKGTWP